MDGHQFILHNRPLLFPCPQSLSHPTHPSSFRIGYMKNNKAKSTAISTHRTSHNRHHTPSPTHPLFHKHKHTTHHITPHTRHAPINNNIYLQMYKKGGRFSFFPSWAQWTIMTTIHYISSISHPKHWWRFPNKKAKQIKKRVSFFSFFYSCLLVSRLLLVIASFRRTDILTRHHH